MRKPVVIALFIALALTACSTDAKKAKQYMSQGDWAKAQEHMIKAVQADPKNARLHNELGFIYEKRKYYELAEKEYKQATALMPGYIEANYNLGNVLFHMFRYPEAMQQFEQVIQLDPNHALAKNNLALIIQISQGDLKRAEQLYLEAVKLQPDNPSFQENLAKLYTDMKEPEKAAEASKRAAALRAKNP